MKSFRFPLIALVVLVLVAGITVLTAGFFDHAAAETVGKVTRMQGPATRTTGGKTSNLAMDMQVDMGDVIATGAEARLELTFRDGTLVTLGEKSKLTIDEYVYRPGAASGRMKVSISGAFRYISGNMPKSAETERSVTTPAATIGIRGTNFWGGPLEGQFSVFLFDGSISVANSAGLALMGSPGLGVDIGPNGTPTQPVQWNQTKIDSAISSVTFR